MQQYLTFLKNIRDKGVHKADRTGVGTIGLFGQQMRFDLSAGFPLVTTKKTHWKSIVYELLWFLRGDTNIKFLNDHGVKIWNEWADDNGDLGHIYGYQWRSWPTADGKSIDQISRVITDIKQNPNSRRLIVNAWNVGELDKMALPPCHTMFQFYVANGTLSCQLYQRSADAFLGVPFNIASYALLTHMVACECNLAVGDFIWTGGDCHIYTNHLEQIAEQLTRKPYPLPTLQFNNKPNAIVDYNFADIELLNYQCHPRISAPIAV